MGKGKLEKFAELKTFTNTIEIPDGHLIDSHPLKGNWSDEIFQNSNPIVLELGCGKGEYTVNMARKFPKKNFIGVDIKGNRIWTGAKAAHEEGLKNVAFVRIRIDFVEKVFGENEVSEIWVTFPDPQPKKERKRLTSPFFLEKYRSFIKPDAPVHLKTDNFPLYEYTAELIKENDFELIDSSAQLYKDLEKNAHQFANSEEVLRIKTFYERMFLDEGKNICYLRFKI